MLSTSLIDGLPKLVKFDLVHWHLRMRSWGETTSASSSPASVNNPLTPPLPGETMSQAFRNATACVVWPSNGLESPRKGVTMTSRKLIPFLLVMLLGVLCTGVPAVAGDSSHARVIRLSVVQGDVRFARETHGDPLVESNASWEAAG